LKTIQAKVSKTPSQQITCAWCAHLWSQPWEATVGR
jgi:hypothetical protein